jgi:signal transduction histidine kinase
MSKTTKILVVEDELGFERLLRQRLPKEISSGIYEFVFTGNGKEALALLENEADIDIVLSDINMPVMDGLTLLGTLRKTRPGLITVIISAYGDMPNIRAAMNLGAFDFVTKPIDFADLKTTLQKAVQEVELLRRAEKARELELMNEQLRKLDRMKSEFLTNVSHEFRTPLTVIDGMADQILAKPDRWLSRGVDMIKRNNAYLLNLVDQILDLTKLDDGTMKLSMVQGNIIDCLRQVVEPFYAQAERKNIQLTLVDELPELQMDYDPGKLQRVLSNLLSNALKFTPEGGEVAVTVKNAASAERTRSALRTLSIEVKDTGTGIPEDQLPFIFDRFFQVDASSTRSAEGAGLGLALVKELLELMDGHISVSSKEGEGSVFGMALPIRRKAKWPDGPRK